MRDSRTCLPDRLSCCSVSGIEMRSVRGASRALEELVKIMPSEAHLMKESGETEDVSIETLKLGDLVLIRPGEKIPVDGVVIEGTSSLNESMLTGESKPVSRKPGDTVTGGSINGEGSLVAEVKKTGKDTYLNQEIDLVQKPNRASPVDRASRAKMYNTDPRRPSFAKFPYLRVVLLA